MVVSIGVLPKKRGRPATSKDPMLIFRAPRPLAALGAWLAAQYETRPSRSEAIWRLLAQGAESAGKRKERSLSRTSRTTASRIN
jgi:hypothetical protein